MNKGTYITNKRDIKIMKATILFDILEYCMDKNINLTQIIMYNYPMQWQKNVIDDTEFNYSLDMKSLSFL